MLKCIIVDEQPRAALALKNFIKKFPFLEYTATFHDPKSALLYLGSEPADLIFLSMRKAIPAGHADILILKKHGLVVLTSANKKLALDGFDHDVMDFLAKPVSLARFTKTAEKAYRIKTATEPVKISPGESLKGGFIFIKEATRLVRVELDDIYYVMGLKNYVSIVTKSQRIVSLQTMKQIEELLPANRFIRVHRSYFVALDKIISIEKQQIHVKDKRIPIGQIYLSAFMKRLTPLSNQ